MKGTADPPVEQAPVASDRARRDRRLGVVAAALLGAAGSLLGLSLAAHVEAPIGPFDATLSARPSLDGNTLVRLAPLGTVGLDTHDAPVAVEVRMDELRREDAEAIAQDPTLLSSLEDRLADDVRSGLWALLGRAALAAVAGGALLSLIGCRRLRSAVVGGGVGGLFVLAGGGLAVATWRPEAVAEPRYSGLLSAAPRAVGDVEGIIERFGQYRAQLADLVGNVVALYRAGQALPTFAPDTRTVRVLHVSDLHLNPQAFDLMEQLVKQFDVDAVVDAGDTTDFGTEAENQAVVRIGRLPVPYVWVRGNHDSPGTAAAVAAQPNAVVLDGQARQVAGIRFFGAGDPRFTPDKDQETGKDVERRQADRFAPRVATLLRSAEPPDVDVLVVHDPRTAARSGGLVPLVLAGHTHEPREGRIGRATLLVQGSTGGAGLRGLQGEFPEPLTASVLYFDARTRRLVAYDQISIRGLGETGARIERHIVGQGGVGRGDGPEETTSTSPSPPPPNAPTTSSDSPPPSPPGSVP